MTKHFNVLLYVFFLLCSTACSDNPAVEQDSSSVFLQLSLYEYYKQEGNYPDDLLKLRDTVFFKSHYPKNKIGGLNKLLSNETFDYAGNDDSKEYLYSYSIDNVKRTIMKMEEGQAVD